MELDEYRASVINEIKTSASQNQTDIIEELLTYYCDILRESEEFDDYYPCNFNITGHRNKSISLDGYSNTESDGSLILFIVDHSTDEKLTVFPLTDIKKKMQKLTYYINDVLKGTIFEYIDESDPIYELSEEIKEKYSSISKLRFYILSDRKLGKKFLELDCGKINGKPVEVNVWDINRLYQLETSKNGKEKIVIDFNEWGTERIVCIKVAGEIENGCTSYIGSIPGKLLSDLYRKYGARLLEGNVRSFLSARGNVNKGIKGTLTSQPEMFFVYNNGIAATASKALYNEETNQIESLEDLQIINGGQTTASIANCVIQNKNFDLSKVVVPIKLTVLKHEEIDDTDREIEEEQRIQDTVQNIARYANSQNKVDESDFFSTNPYCVRLEDFSRRIMAPAKDNEQFNTYWFFERARGQYFQQQLKMTKAQKDNFKRTHPKNQMLTKTDIAKYLQSYDMLPQVVSQGAQVNARRFAIKVTADWKKDDKQFNELYYKKLIAKAILFRRVEKIVSASDWYKTVKSYRANVVTYSIALLRLLIKKYDDNLELDLMRIWNEQDLYYELVKTLEDLTKVVFYKLTSNDRETDNVTQWAKREHCWQGIQSIDFEFSDDFIETLKRINHNEEKEAKQDQKIINGINYQTVVDEKGSRYWNEALDFGYKNNLFSSEKEISVVKLATHVDSGKIPTDKQSKIICDVNERFKKFGFRSF